MENDRHGRGYAKANAAYIAAANPTAVLELLDELDRRAAQIERMRYTVKWIDEVCEKNQNASHGIMALGFIRSIIAQQTAERPETRAARAAISN